MTRECDALQCYTTHYLLAPIINTGLFLTFAYCMIHTSRAESVWIILAPDMNWIIFMRQVLIFDKTPAVNFSSKVLGTSNL